MAGQRDFTVDEWSTLQRAMIASGVLVSLDEGKVDQDEMFALQQRLRGTSTSHRSQFIRELASLPTFSTGLQMGTTFADYARPALDTIQAATAIVGKAAPDELAAFRALLVDLAEIVAHANEEGGVLGMGGRTRTPNEGKAVEAVKKALGIAS